MASGGSIALHKLADNLIGLGHRAWLLAERKNLKWQGELLKPDRKNPQALPQEIPDPVTVYPEVVCGNPFQAPRVVRWILNTPGVCGGDGVFGDRDLIMLWAKEYSVDSKYRVAGELTAQRDWAHFRDLGGPRRGSCYLVRKGVDRKLHPRDALCIDRYGYLGGDDYLLKVFNERNVFYCYDDHTALIDIARLCGCVVLPLRVSPPAVDRFELARRQTREFIALCQQQWPELACPA